MSEEQLSKSALRDEVVDQLHQLIVGPIEPDELIEGRLNLRYFAGILFPKGSSRSGLAQQTSESLDEDTTGSVPESGHGCKTNTDHNLRPRNMKYEYFILSRAIEYTQINYNLPTKIFRTSRIRKCKL